MASKELHKLRIQLMWEIPIQELLHAKVAFKIVTFAKALSGNHFVLAMASDKVGSPVSSLVIWMPDQKPIVQLSLTRLTSRLMQLT